jgi:hypothetical protein
MGRGENNSYGLSSKDFWPGADMHRSYESMARHYAENVLFTIQPAKGQNLTGAVQRAYAAVISSASNDVNDLENTNSKGRAKIFRGLYGEDAIQTKIGNAKKELELLSQSNPKFHLFENIDYLSDDRKAIDVISDSPKNLKSLRGPSTSDLEM